MDKTLVVTEESTGAVLFFEKLWKINMKIPLPESYFNKVSGIETCNVVKK